MSRNFCFLFNFFVPKTHVFESFRWGIIPVDFVGFPFRTSKLKNNISYIKYKFSHRLRKVCRWLNMYYSKIRIIIFFKVTTMFIWIILKNHVWTWKKCNFYRYWATVTCIYPMVKNHVPYCFTTIEYLNIHEILKVLVVNVNCDHVFDLLQMSVTIFQMHWW